MAIDPGSIQHGMEVLGIDGELLGHVVRVEPGPTTPSTHGTHAAGRVDAGGSSAAAAGGPGPMPPGTTSDKGRGVPDASAIVSGRGDIPSAPRTVDTPGEGGVDALRGYGDAGDVQGTPETVGRTAGGLENQRGGFGTPPATAPTPGARHDVIFVEGQGFFGVGAGGLHIPLADVFEVTPGHRIILDCTRAQAIERYGGGRSLDLNDQVSA